MDGSWPQPTWMPCSGLSCVPITSSVRPSQPLRSGAGPDDAAAPVAAGVEVRLVGVPVVDRRQHGHLARVVERAQPGQAGMPAEARRVAERQGRRGIDADARAQLARSARRRWHERVEAVVAAVEVERDQDRRVRRARRPGPRPPPARRASRGRARRWRRAAARRRRRAGRGARGHRARTRPARRARARGSARAAHRRCAAPRACRASRCSRAASADLRVGAGEQDLAQHALALGPVVLDLPLLVPAGDAAPAVGRERGVVALLVQGAPA